MKLYRGKIETAAPEIGQNNYKQIALTKHKIIGPAFYNNNHISRVHDQTDKQVIY